MDALLERFNTFWMNLRLTWRLVQDERVPAWTKLVPVLTVLYIVSPIDFIPDFLLILGQLDDLLVISLGFQFFQRLCPPEIVEQHRLALEAEQQMDGLY